MDIRAGLGEGKSSEASVFSSSSTSRLRKMSLAADPPAVSVPAAGGTSTHQLANSGAAKIVFKVKSSNNTEYRMSPVFGFIEPGASAPLEITRLAGAPKEDKLVVEYGDAPADVASAQDAIKGVAAPQKLTIPMTAA